MNEIARTSVTELRQNSSTAYVASINQEGYPVMRAMLVLEHDSFKTQYFSTNTSSGKVGYFLSNPKASVYYCDPGNFKGVLFVGDMQVCTDQETKTFLWREGFERYYPKGVTDEDYCVLKFTAHRGSFYQGLNSASFSIDELEDPRATKIAINDHEELLAIVTKFAESGWEVIEGPARAWLAGQRNGAQLIAAVQQAEQECGSCGCEFDPLYKRALELKALL